MGIFFWRPNATELMAKGRALLEQGELDAAFEAMKAAAAADRRAAAPLAWMADIATRKLAGAGVDEVQRLCTTSDELARSALALDNKQYLPCAVLGRLALLRQPSRQTCGDAARRAIHEGNELFARERFHDAQSAFERASLEQPELAQPVKLAGNCQFALAKETNSAARYREAERLFRRAIELDPMDPQAHHFLADTYLRLSRPADALAATIAAIEANPAYYPAWQVLRAIRAPQGRDLRTFRICPLATASRPDNGPPTLSVGTRHPGEAAAWIIYAASKAGLAGTEEPTSTSDLAAELRGLRAAGEFVRNNPPKKRSPAGLHVLHELAEMDAKGDLTVAILLLAFKEEYREDFEALKREQPAACSEFLHRYDLRPF